MPNKQSVIAIKGTKDGLMLALDDQCSYQTLIEELENKLFEHENFYNDGPLISVKVSAGNRYLTDEQVDEIKNIVRSKKQLFVEDIDSHVMTKAACQEIINNSGVHTIIRMIRSGQVVEMKGDLLLIGDVNPGAEIKATGNIYVLGALRGSAHAGYGSEGDFIICASVMKPEKLTICETTELISEQTGSAGTDMICAYIDKQNEQMIIDKLQTLNRMKQLNFNF